MKHLRFVFQQISAVILAAEETPTDTRASSKPLDLPDTSANADISLSPDTDTSPPPIVPTAHSDIATVDLHHYDELSRSNVVGSVLSHDEGTTTVTETRDIIDERDSDVPKMPLPEVDALLPVETASSEEIKRLTSELKLDADSMATSEVVAAETNSLASEPKADLHVDQANDPSVSDDNRRNDPSFTDERDTKDLIDTDDSETDDPSFTDDTKMDDPSAASDDSKITDPSFVAVDASRKTEESSKE